ncbi:MAG: hypothetical protein QG626_751 [Patescibacteria group bacterium]|jgi:hypothetical protein|nr:hypothetical protein [Patescibacteria group bacterium]
MSLVEKKIYTNTEGYIALMSVLVLSVIGVAIMSAALVLGANESRLSEFVDEAMRTQVVTDVCVEEALQVVKDAGACIDTGGEVALGDATCTYVASGSGGSTCDVQVTSTVGDISRSAHVTVTSSETGLELLSWEETLN